MPHVGPGVEETLIGIFFEVLLYGAFCVVAYECAGALRARAQANKTHWYMTFTFVALFVMITMRTVVDFKRTIISFTNPSDTGAIDLGMPKSVESIMTNTLLVAITVVADAFLIYRVFVVWRNNFLIIVVPVLLCMGTTGGGVYVIWALCNADIKNGVGAFLRVNEAFTIFLYFTLSANGLCTVLIAGRILWVRRNSSGARASRGDAVSRLLALIVESAAVYSAVLIAEIVAIARGSPTSFTFINLIGPLVGIVFSYIIIRAARNSHPLDTTSAVNTSRTAGTSQNSGHGYHGSRGGTPYHYRGGSRAHGDSRHEPVQIQLETIKQQTSSYPYGEERGGKF